MLTLHHLRILTHIAKHGSLTQAAVAMHVTQSALSHQIKDLEVGLGLPLFQRIGKKLSFTEAGERVLQSAHVILAEIETAHGDLKRLGARQAGLVRISTECYTCYQWLPPVLAAFQAIHPAVQVQIVAEATTNPLPFLLQGQLDVAVVSNPVPLAGWRNTPLFEDELVCLVAPQHPWARLTRPLEAADFSTETLLVYTKQNLGGTVKHAFFDSLQPRAILEVHLTEAIVELVQAQIGVAIMARWAAQPFLATKPLCSLPLPAGVGQRTWYACALATPSPAVSYLLALMQEKLLPTPYAAGV